MHRTLKAKTACAIGFIEVDFGTKHAVAFRRDLHPDFLADTAKHVSAKPKPEATWQLFCAAKDDTLPIRSSTSPTGFAKKWGLFIEL